MASAGQGIEGFVEDTFLNYVSVIHTIFSIENSLRTLIDEAQHHVGNIFGFLLNSLFANNSSARGIDVALRQAPASDQWEEPPPDPPLSPAQTTPTPTSNSKDEWGHFADFKDELANESSFLPSCAPERRSSLETLSEDDCCEDEDAFSF